MVLGVPGCSGGRPWRADARMWTPCLWSHDPTSQSAPCHPVSGHHTRRHAYSPSSSTQADMHVASGYNCIPKRNANNGMSKHFLDRQSVHVCFHATDLRVKSVCHCCAYVLLSLLSQLLVCQLASPTSHVTGVRLSLAARVASGGLSPCSPYSPTRRAAGSVLTIVTERERVTMT